MLLHCKAHFAANKKAPFFFAAKNGKKFVKKALNKRKTYF